LSEDSGPSCRAKARPAGLSFCIAKKLRPVRLYDVADEELISKIEKLKKGEDKKWQLMFS
jgi:hypothetical protein